MDKISNQEVMDSLHKVGSEIKKSEISRKEQVFADRMVQEDIDSVALRHSLSRKEAASAAKMALNTFDKYIAEAMEEGVINDVQKVRGKWQYTLTHMHLFLDWMEASSFKSNNPDYGCHVVNIQNQKGGTGKSTAAINIAAGLALPLDKRLKVCLIDLDPQGSLRQFMDLDENNDEFVTAVEIMLGQNNPEGSAYQEYLKDGYSHEEIVQQFAVIPSHIPNLYIMPAMPSDEAFTAHAWEEKLQTGNMTLLKSMKTNIIDHLAPHFDVILIDTGPHNNPLTWAAAYASHGLLIPCAPHQLDWHSTSQFMENLPLILKQNLPDDWPGFSWWRLLCTNFDDSEHKQDSQMLDSMKNALGAKILNDVIKKSEFFEEATSKQLTIWDIQKTQSTVSRLQWEKAVDSMKNVRQSLLLTMIEHWPRTQQASN